MGNISKKDLEACIKRELAMRKVVYPKRVNEGKMKPEAATHEINCMQGVFNLIKGLDVDGVTVEDQTAPGLLQSFRELHGTFFREATGVGYKECYGDDKCLEEIIIYLRKESLDSTDEGLLKVWKFIFQKWDLVGDFIGRQKSLMQINRNLNEILDKIRNGHNGKSAAKNKRDNFKAGIVERRQSGAGSGHPES